MTAIRVENLVKTYGNFRALDGLSFEVEEGEIHGYLGPNGAGKTTTIRILMGLLHSDEGKILIYDENSEGRDFSLMSRIGYMPEMPSFPSHLTANELLDIYGQIYSIPKEERMDRSSELLALVGLKNYEEEKIETFSKGMRQRLGVAQALISDPDLLILDEPTAGLDPGSRANIRSIVKDIGDEGITVFISSHLLEEIEKTCSHATIIDEGKCVMSGAVEEISKFHESTELEIEVHGLNDEIVEAVENLPQADSVETEEGKMRVFLSEEESRIPVSKAITDVGGVIIGMNRRTRSLEDVFLEVTEGGSEDEQIK